MANQLIPSIISVLLLAIILVFTEVEAAKKNYENPIKLFVFGDSYVDTGNFVHSESYKPPYGMTFPGQPAGRFSDGRVITDYIASHLKIESPIPYAFRNSSNMQYGINFAYGGTGVFSTSIDGPNATVQIDSFQNLIQQNIITKYDLQSSIALFNAGGNDYTYALKSGRLIDLPGFMSSLVKQLSMDLERIHSLGINKVAVGLLPPSGCLPVLNFIYFHKKCVETWNKISRDHNKMVLQAIQQFNQESSKSVFIPLDFYNSFLSVIETMEKKENATLINPLEPCCDGQNLDATCGSVDDKGSKKYSLCDDPKLSFFWDTVHPSQNGWFAVFTILQSSLGQLTT